MMTIVFFFIRIHQFTLFSRRHPFIQDTTKKTNSVCCVQFKNNNECTYHVWRLLVSHHCLPSNNVPSSFVLCDENTIWWTFFTNVWIWGHTGKALELKRLDRVILEDAFLGQRFNSVGRRQFLFCSIFNNLHVDISESQYKRNKTAFLVVRIQLYALVEKDITHRRDSHCSFFGSTWVNSEDMKEQLCRRLGRAPSGTGRLGHLAGASHLALRGRNGHPDTRLWGRTWKRRIQSKKKTRCC